MLKDCPFYGRTFVQGRFVPGHGTSRALPFALINSGGNQCALVTDGFAPCYLEIEAQPVDWRQCTRVQATLLG